MPPAPAAYTTRPAMSVGMLVAPPAMPLPRTKAAVAAMVGQLPKQRLQGGLGEQEPVDGPDVRVAAAQVGDDGGQCRRRHGDFQRAEEGGKCDGDETGPETGTPWERGCWRLDGACRGWLFCVDVPGLSLSGRPCLRSPTGVYNISGHCGRQLLSVW